jgi:glutaredoxin 3
MKFFLIFAAAVLVLFSPGCKAFAPRVAAKGRPGILLKSSSSSSNEQLAEIQEKAAAFLDNFVEATKYRFGLFREASKQYNFKQCMAITIAGDDYDSKQVQEEIKSIVDSNPCVMFIWEASPSCKQAIQAFESMGDNVNLKIVRLDDPWSEGNKMRAELGKMTGKSSVPSVWIGGEYIGGYDAGVSEEAPGLVKMAFQGTLRPKLEAAGALK